MSGDNPNFIALLNKGREFKIAAKRASQEAHRFDRMSRQFYILAPIMDKQGKGALHDIFVSCPHTKYVGAMYVTMQKCTYQICGGPRDIISACSN